MTTEDGAFPAGRAFNERVLGRVGGGARFGGLFGSAEPGGTRLVAVLADGGTLDTETVVVPGEEGQFPSLTPCLPAAAWYEREIHDLFGLEPLGHGRLDPLILPLVQGSPRPRPGSGKPLDPVEVDLRPLPAHLRGEGVFTIPYGPVRSGVFESVEYLVETPGEDIPHLRTRVFHKHRGVEVRFEGMDVGNGALLAERCEGVATVAHAIAYCGAIERLAGVEIPEAAGLVRVVHAELERVANHLDSVIRHTEAAGQAVAYARLTLHKERVQRLRARLCGSRFGRGVVVPGGVSGAPQLGAGDLFAAIDQIDGPARGDLRLLMATPSFVDRLRGTGVIPPDLARQYAAVGPVGRGSGQVEDVRFARPYAAYGHLGHRLLEPRAEGDALARQRVRLEEIAGAFHLIRQAVDRLDQMARNVPGWAVVIDPSLSGQALGWAEAPQGEVVYYVVVEEGRLVRVKPRSASFHNLGLFHAAFPKDILTDFAFIEASFGLSMAGVAN
ncbi:MAG TPA: NADH-quinone oxidoreductase subunit C [Acidimicrobiales bacterium]|nr:NADH-quinone oxidoreductase subunit C [Acidimicrobiales bacterium]